MLDSLESNLTKKDRIELQKLQYAKNGKKTKVLKYIFAILVCTLGLLVKLVLIKTIKYPEGGFLLSTGTIMISAWYGGLGPGLLATALNYLISDYFFITPEKFFFNDRFVDQFRFIIFITEGVFISWLFESLHKAHQKTKEALYKTYLSEKLVRSLIENIKDYAIFMIDVKGYIRTWNEGATMMTGYLTNEVLGKPLSILFPTHTKRKNNLVQYLQTAKARGQYKQEGWKMRKGDSLFWAETTITALPNSLTNTQNFSIILHDVTARKRIDELKSEFLSMISHELRTPIAVLKIIIENILRHGSKKQNREIKNGEIDDLNSEVSRLELLMENVLDITKLRIKKFSLNLKTTELTSLTNKVMKEMQLIAGENKPIIVHSAKKITVLGDQIRIEQVLMNLIDNAIKFTQSKGKIEITIRVVKKMAIISVSNEANQLIPKNNYLLIFDKFYQMTKKPVEGLGLGLYISREIIKQHQGKMWVSTTKGKNIFHFSLPVK